MDHSVRLTPPPPAPAPALGVSLQGWGTKQMTHVSIDILSVCHFVIWS